MGDLFGEFFSRRIQSLGFGAGQVRFLGEAIPPNQQTRADDDGDDYQRQLCLITAILAANGGVQNRHNRYNQAHGCRWVWSIQGA